MATSGTLTLDVYRGRESVEAFETEQSKFVAVARSAFTGADAPRPEDVLDHVTDSSTLVVARAANEPVGFAAVVDLPDAELLVQHAIAVDETHQGERVGEILLDLATFLEADGGDVVVGGRTQVPYLLEYFARRGGFPRKGGETPPTCRRWITPLAEYYGDVADVHDHVLRNGYSGQLYDDETILAYEAEIPEFVTGEVDLSRGDGVLAVGELSLDDVALFLTENLRESAFSFEWDYSGLDAGIGPLEANSDEFGPWDVLSLLGVEPLSPVEAFANQVELLRWPATVDPVGERRTIAVFGCGDGKLLPVLASKYDRSKITALERSPAFARIAEERTAELDDVDVVHGDGLDFLRDAEDRFDVVYAINSVQETPDPVATLGDVFYECTTPGGLVVATYPSNSDALPTEDGVLRVEVRPDVLLDALPEAYEELRHDTALRDSEIDAVGEMTLEQRYVENSREAFPDSKYDVEYRGRMEVPPEGLDEILAVLEAGGMAVEMPDEKPSVEYVVARTVP